MHRPMRRPERALEPQQAEQFVREHQVARLATVSPDGWPYVVTVNYAYSDGSFIIHSAPVGHKVENLVAEPRVCLEVAEVGATRPGPSPCAYSVSYTSVVAFGRARLATGAERHQLLEQLARALAGDEVRLEPGVDSGVAVIVVEVEAMTGKRSPG